MDLMRRQLGRVTTMQQPRAWLETASGTVPVRTRVFRAEEVRSQFDGRVQFEASEPHCYVDARLAPDVATGDHLTDTDGIRWRVFEPLPQDDGTIKLMLGDPEHP